MTTDTFSCPECGVKLRRSPHLRPGVRVQCPQCKIQFAVPSEVQESPEPPARRAQEPPPAPRDEREYDHRAGTRRADDAPPPPPPGRYDEDDFPRPDRREPAGHDEDYPRPGRYDEDYPRDRDAGDVSPDYRVDMGQWFNYARQHWSQLLGPAVGFLILYAIIVFPLQWILTWVGAFLAISQNLPPALLMVGQQLLGAGITVLLSGPLYAGMTAACLVQLKGQRWGFGEFFAGFKRYPATAGLSGLNLLLLLPMYLGQVLLQIYTGSGMGGGPMGMMAPEESLVYMAANLAWLAVYAFLYVRLMFFAMPLVFDRGLGPIEAVKASWKMTEGHTLSVLGIVLVLLLINVGGGLACCIGLLFSLPFTGLCSAAGYLLAAGTRPPVALEYHDEDYGPRVRYDGGSRRDRYEDDRPRRRADEYDDRRGRDDDDRPRGRRPARDPEDEY